MSEYKKYNLDGEEISSFDYIMKLINSNKSIEGKDVLVFMQTLEDLVESNDLEDFKSLKENYLRYMNSEYKGYKEKENIDLIVYKNFKNIAILLDNSNLDSRREINSLVKIVNQKYKLNQIKKSKAYNFVKKNFYR